jgi:hypothetical protein
MAQNVGVKSPQRVKVGLAVAVGLSIWGAIAYFGYEAEFEQQSRDPYRIAAQTARLEDLRASVPQDAILGYLTDLEAGSMGATVAFNAAQYALAPRLLRPDAAQRLVLGNFAHPADFAALGHQHGLRVERDFGSGVVLFRRDSQP